MNDFDTELARAKHGDEMIYHVGYHCLAEPKFVTRNKQAKAAWDAYLRGDVLLYQRRIGPGKLQYCAKVLR